MALWTCCHKGDDEFVCRLEIYMTQKLSLDNEPLLRLQPCKTSQENESLLHIRDASDGPESIDPRRGVASLRLYRDRLKGGS